MHPGVTTLIGGFSATEHLEEAAGVSGSDGLTPQEMARVEMVWKANFGLPHGTD
jgi:aryl-alcohol dehydrogenase-like predicted oxidoreductase